MTEQICATCRYFTSKLSKHSSVRYPEGTGECRRNAPRGPVNLGWTHGDPKDGAMHIAITSSFPSVPSDDWCGDWAPRPDEASA